MLLWSPRKTLTILLTGNLVGWREMSASLFAFWIKNEISSSGTWCVHTINIQVTELSLLRCYDLRMRKKLPHELYIRDLHKFSRFWLIKRESQGEEGSRGMTSPEYLTFCDRRAMSTLSSKFTSCIRYASGKFSGKQTISLLKQENHFLKTRKHFLF